MRLVLLVAVLSASASAQAPDTLRVALDLRAGLEGGWLGPADTVGLRGDLPPLSWNATVAASDPDGDGVYHAAIPFDLAADTVTVALKIKVDGSGDAPNGGWQEGRNHTARLVRGAGGDLALAWGDRPPPPPSTVTGRVDVVEGVGGFGLAPRAVYVWLPPGYADGDRRYPVLYLHDGQNVFDAAAAGAEWGMDEAATALLAAGEIEPVILVGVANTSARIDEYTPVARTWRRELVRTAPPSADGPLGGLTGAFATDDGAVTVAADGPGLTVEIPGGPGAQPLTALDDGRFYLPGADLTFAFERGADGVAGRIVATKPDGGGGAAAYGRLLVETVKPLVEARYRTLAGPAHTGLGGSSLGGLVTMYLGLEYPDVFGRLLVASPSVWWADRWILGAVAAAEATAGQRVWLDMGTAEGEGMVAGARALRDALAAAGWADVRYVEAEDAAHTERAWAARAPDMLRFLFPAE